MPEFVRVTDPVSGAQVTVTKQRAKALDLDPLKADATGPFGHALPATPGKPRKSGDTTTTSSATKKES